MDDEKFLCWWFGHTSPLLEIRSISRGVDHAVSRDWFTRPGDAVQCARHALFSSRDVYVGALPRWRRGGGASDVGERKFLFADVDCGTDGHARPAPHATREDALSAIRSFRLPPSVTVDTGGGFQAWWALRRNPSIADWRMAMSAIVGAVGGDRAATDLARILRIPGTLNRKREPARPVRLIELTDHSYDVDDFLELPGCTPIEIELAPSPHRRLAASPTERPRIESGGRPFDLANDVPVAHVLERMIGVTTLHREGARTYCACPICPGDDAHEMVVGGLRNVATCFGDCGGRAFSSVDLVAAHRSCTPIEAVRAIVGAFELPVIGLRR